MDSVNLKGEKLKLYARGVIASAKFLILEFEGDEKSLDYAAALVGELCRNYGIDLVYSVIERLEMRVFENILWEIELQQK